MTDFQQPPASQRPLILPARIPNGALQGLVAGRNPLKEHYDGFFERCAFLAECQAKMNGSSGVAELEESLCQVIDYANDSEKLRQAILVTADNHGVGQVPPDTRRSVYERTEVMKTNYRDLQPLQKYGDARAYDEFKRRVFDIQNPDEEYPGSKSFFRTAARDQEARGDDDDDDGDLEMTYRSKRNLKCPITMMTFREPVRSKVCVHVFSRDAVMEMLRRNDGEIECPVAGCDKFLTQQDLQRDRVTERRVRDEEEEEGNEGEELSSAAGDDVLDIL